MNAKKILLLSFGNPGEHDPRIINNSFSQTAKDNISLSTHTITHIPNIGDLFMVGGDAYDDLVFKCVRYEGEKIKSNVDGHEFVIFGAFVHRLSFMNDEKLKRELLEFRT